MKGGINESTLTSKSVFDGNTQIIQDYKTFHNLNIVLPNPSESNPGCYFDTSDSYCYGGTFYRVRAVPAGSVYVNDSSSNVGCTILGNGRTYCRDE